MNGENDTLQGGAANQDDGSGYQRSTIAYPYFDLAESLKLVYAISNNVGGGYCTDDQLAPWVDLSPKSSGYRSRMSAARLFGLIETGGEQGHRLSELGLKALDANHARAAKVEAFLKVPLFKRVYENWRGQQIPPAAALERAMVTFGVAEKQTARARQTLERSANVANFFEQGRDRLVKPGIKPGLATKDERQPAPGGSGGGGSDDPPKYDPIIQGLFNRLPTSGDVWPMSERKLWLQILENSFELVYKDKVERLPSPDMLRREQEEAAALNQSLAKQED